MFNRKATGFAALLTAILLSAFSCNVFANRPSMEERGDAAGYAADEASADISTEAPAQPSSIEIMMQQQSQQPQRPGDVVPLPAKEMQPGETIKVELLDFPHRGMSMEKVQFEYGQPIAISDSVGEPPITRWTYSDRVVYFEYSIVLHVVAR